MGPRSQEGLIGREKGKAKAMTAGMGMKGTDSIRRVTMWQLWGEGCR
jgi:hypothetical protein